MHRLDAAQLFRLALKNAPAGARLHGVADEGVPVRDIDEVIGRHSRLPVNAVAVIRLSITSASLAPSSRWTSPHRAQ